MNIRKIIKTQLVGVLDSILVCDLIEVSIRVKPNFVPFVLCIMIAFNTLLCVITAIYFWIMDELL